MATTLDITYSNFYALFGPSGYSSMSLSSDNRWAYIGHNKRRDRTVFQFDISALPAGAIITDLKLSYHIRRLESPRADSYYIAMTTENLSGISNAQLISTVQAIDDSAYTYKQNAPRLLNELTKETTYTDTLEVATFKNIFNTTSTKIYVILGLNTVYTGNVQHYARVEIPGSTTYIKATAPTLSITYVQGTMFYGVNNQWKECLVYYGTSEGWKQVMPFYGTASGWVQVR